MSQAETQNEINLHISRINPDGFYSRDEVASLLGVKNDRVTHFVQLGLQHLPMSDQKNAKWLFDGLDLIRFVRAYGMAMRILALKKAQQDEEKEPPTAG